MILMYLVFFCCQLFTVMVLDLTVKNYLIYSSFSLHVSTLLINFILKEVKVDKRYDKMHKIMFFQLLKCVRSKLLYKFQTCLFYFYVQSETKKKSYQPKI